MDQMSTDHVVYVYKRTQSWLLRRGRHRAFSFLFFKLKLYFSSVISIFWEDMRVLTRIQQQTHKQTICLTFKQVRNQVNIYRRIAGQLFLELHSFVKYFI